MDATNSTAIREAVHKVISNRDPQPFLPYEFTEQVRVCVCVCVCVCVWQCSLLRTGYAGEGRDIYCSPKLL